MANVHALDKTIVACKQSVSECVVVKHEQSTHSFNPIRLQCHSLAHKLRMCSSIWFNEREFNMAPVGTFYNVACVMCNSICCVFSSFIPCHLHTVNTEYLELKPNERRDEYELVLKHWIAFTNNFLFSRSRSLHLSRLFLWMCLFSVSCHFGLFVGNQHLH